MNKKILCGIIALTLLLALCAACQPVAQQAPAQPEAGQPAAPAVEGKKIKIGASLGLVSDVFDRLLYEGMMKFADEHKDEIELMVIDARGDLNAQLTNMDQMINSKVDAIVLWSIDVDALIPAVEKANAANIPVVCVNTIMNGGKFVYVGSDDVEAGKIQGEWLIKNLPSNTKYGYIVGRLGHSGMIGRKTGFEETVLKERTDCEKLAEQTSEWDREKALKIAEDWIKAFPDMTAIICQNDNSALGAIEACRTAGKLDQMFIVGVDATEEACEKIKIGELKMSVFQNAAEQGIKSIEVAMQIVKDEWTGGDELLIPFIAVDSSNVDEYLAMYKNQ